MEQKYNELNSGKNQAVSIDEQQRIISKDTLHSLQIALICIYFTFILAFILSCFFFPGVSFIQLIFIKMKSNILSFFLIMQSGSFKVYLILIICAVLLYIFCFPVAILELFLGKIIHPFWFAYVIALTIKMLSNATMFYIARSLLKEEIKNYFLTNKIFATIQYAIKKNPMKIIFMLKLMMIPHVVKNYGLGVMEISFIQFIIPSLVTGSIFTMFWVHMGCKLDNIHSIFNSNEMQKNKEIEYFEYLLFIFVNLYRIGIIFLSLVLFGLLVSYGKKMYEQVQKEVERDKQIKEEGDQKTYGTMQGLENQNAIF